MKAAGKSVVLIMLIIIMALGGLLWFDYLGVIYAKKVFAPVYKLLKLTPQTSKSATQTPPLLADIDEERLNKQRDAQDIRDEELNKREIALTEREQKISQHESVVDEKEKSQEAREQTFALQVKQLNDRDRNAEQIANYLNGMTPQAAVGILLGHDDQTVIDVLRKVEELAARNNTSSMGGYWLSLMPSERAATIQRKMLSKPESLD